MNNQMTLLAFAGKWDARGARGFTAEAIEATEGAAEALPGRTSKSSSNPDSASSPNPFPARLRNCRRDRKWGWGGAKIFEISSITALCSFHVDELVQAHQRLAEVGQGELSRVAASSALVRRHLLG